MIRRASERRGASDERTRGEDAAIETALARHEQSAAPEAERLWSYYRNPRVTGRTAGADPGAAELYQARGLPRRLRHRGPQTDDRAMRPDIVIENDIAWRIDALVDFAFGKPGRIVSQAEDAQLASRIEAALEAVLEGSGGAELVRDAALLGSVHGHVDFVVRMEEMLKAARARRVSGEAALLELARLVRIETVAADRGVPVLDPHDYRVLRGYIVRSRVERAAAHAGASRGALARLLGRESGGRDREIVEVLTAERRRVLVDGETVDDAALSLGVLPVVHVQNASQPLRYAGMSDVEPLIPLQDELNTRLSDRAHRVTMQSFNMFLAKGLDPSAGEMPVGPGRVWSTDNPEAEVQAFGGDGYSPSEEKHIEEVRESLDKVSSVSPVVLGVVRAKLGHLSSANALRITLLGVLTKTEKKRAAYGRGLGRVCELVLMALDRAGVLRTREADRRVRFEWPDPLPVTEEERLRSARAKLAVGVDRVRVLEELGYAEERSRID